MLIVNWAGTVTPMGITPRSVVRSVSPVDEKNWLARCIVIVALLAVLSPTFFTFSTSGALFVPALTDMGVVGEPQYTFCTVSCGEVVTGSFMVVVKLRSWLPTV